MDPVITKRIVLSGYYGFDNSGDEAVLQSILLALDEQGRANGVRFVPVVLSIQPEKTSRMYGVESVHRMKLGQVISAIRGADGLISGGGSLLQDATSAKTIPYYLAILKIAQWFGKPTFIYSQGIGPVSRGLFFGWIRSIFNKTQYISVRDQESRELLQRMKVSKEITVVPDPVMGMPLGSYETEGHRSEEKPVIGVSVRYWNQDRSELKALAEALRLMLEQSEAVVRFLPFHLPLDTDASGEVRSLIGDKFSSRITTAENVINPQHMLAEVGRCQLLIGMRLHSLIYAASQEVPMLGISYDPKIDQFMKRLQMPVVATTKSIQPERVAEEGLQLLANRSSWREEKKGLISQLKNEAQKPAQYMASFFTKGRDSK
ncbi:polysaccharide pyruvyl transferase CsaB [Paenibacillus sp. OAS669]|uniref:polysaccharide pyruvyl transferase CsaB n=1 Tax=Paenibacillus sp. OAS669 TaxID=2663821 RepID=UPI00178A06A3|nr:polysaccharide pyruvyl transferase CsaB [Paenibacillus sp. OAS669]MBE1447320.1 polysaccharide pyruvyl transferase CsaB [Paenibacillus sp. OAS669]